MSENGENCLQAQGDIFKCVVLSLTLEKIYVYFHYVAAAVN